METIKLFNAAYWECPECETDQPFKSDFFCMYCGKDFEIKTDIPLVAANGAWNKIYNPYNVEIKPRTQTTSVLFHTVEYWRDDNRSICKEQKENINQQIIKGYSNGRLISLLDKGKEITWQIKGVTGD